MYQVKRTVVYQGKRTVVFKVNHTGVYQGKRTVVYQAPILLPRQGIPDVEQQSLVPGPLEELQHLLPLLVVRHVMHTRLTVENLPRVRMFVCLLL